MDKIMETYSYYKFLYGNVFLLFRTGGFYESYYEDAIQIASALHLPRENGCVRIPEDRVLDYIGDLYEISGVESRIISYKNESGNYVLPDVRQIIADKKEDY